MVQGVDMGGRSYQSRRCWAGGASYRRAFALNVPPPRQL